MALYQAPKHLPCSFSISDIIVACHVVKFDPVFIHPQLAYAGPLEEALGS